jgi:hypothetical protein
MRCLLAPILAVLLLPVFSLAQSSYQPGVIVNLKGESVHGFINYAEWENNPKSISFKSGEDGQVVQFTANDIRYFSVNVGHLAEYQSYIGPMTTNSIDVANLPIGRDTSFTTDTVFLKVLQNGSNVTLFSFVDNFKTRFFISEKPADEPKELIYRLYYNSNEENGVDRTVYETSYKGQLYDAAVKAGKSSTPLKNYIKKAAYREADLVNIVSQINGISKTDLSRNNLTKPKGSNIAFAIIGGVLVIIGTLVEFSRLHRG